MSVTANGCITGDMSNKRNTLRCGKCGKYFKDDETVYKHYMRFEAGQFFYSYVPRITFSDKEGMRNFPGNGEPIGFTHSTCEYMGVCNECSLTQYGDEDNRDKRRNIGVRCEVCGCLVVYVAHYYQRKHCFCGNPCEREYFNKRKRDIRALDHLDKYCAVCNISFKPKRVDASTCSNKCRQKMYRASHQNTEQPINRLVPA